jgi:hypothetical protein
MRVIHLHAVVKAVKLSIMCINFTPLNTSRGAREKSKKIRRKCATVAPYSMLYRFLCNAMQRARKNPKNTAQTRHSCTLSGRKQPQVPFASASSPSPSLMERGPGGEARYKPGWKGTTWGQPSPRTSLSQIKERDPAFLHICQNQLIYSKMGLQY